MFYHLFLSSCVPFSAGCLTMFICYLKLNFLKTGKLNFLLEKKIYTKYPADIFQESLNGNNISFNLFTMYILSSFLVTSMISESLGYSSEQNGHRLILCDLYYLRMQILNKALCII